jgi:DNA-binding beta-propeller fold protein YncE
MIHRLLCILIVVFTCHGCWNRERDNPFEPGGLIPISFSATGYDGYVEITWGDPSVTEPDGFNIYRSESGTSGDFEHLAGPIPPGARNYSDLRVVNQKKYAYYITILGQNTESKPSKTVSTTPGPGFHWVVDYWDYLIVRLTYDCTKATRIYYTNYTPYTMIIQSEKTGLVLYTNVGMIESFDLESAEMIDQSADIRHPYSACFDQIGDCSWVIDSSGVLYRVDSDPLNVTEMPASLGHPTSVSIDQETGFLQITDTGLRSVLFINRNGIITSQITSAGGTPLSKPIAFANDPRSRCIWLVDRKTSGDIIYVRTYDEDDFREIDSFPGVSDIEAVPGNSTAWILTDEGIKSEAVQLSLSGIRLSTVSGLSYPLDIAVNKYDNTLLIANSGVGSVLHYSMDNILLGTYSNLNLPVHITTE